MKLLTKKIQINTRIRGDKFGFGFSENAKYESKIDNFFSYLMKNSCYFKFRVKFKVTPRNINLNLVAKVGSRKNNVVIAGIFLKIIVSIYDVPYGKQARGRKTN